MDRVSDDLTKPLGGGRRAPGALARLVARLAERLPVGRIVSGTLMGLAALVGMYLAFVQDPFGGEPHAIVEIGERIAAVPEAAEPERAPGGALVQDVPRDPRSGTAIAIETASGVSVVRPDGQGASSAVIIQIPDAPPGMAAPAPSTPTALAAAPDPRLVERGRHGPLPRIGEDGATPLRVYARPAPPPGAPGTARIAIVVTGLGISQSGTAEAIARLPPDVSLAFAPYGGDLDRHLARAREAGHEAFLQVPMEPFDYPASDPGPHTLTIAADAAQNRDRLHWVMSRLVGYVGVVNFMGGRLTADPAALRPVLDELRGRGIGLLDDGSSSRSVATAIAAEIGLPSARADLVLDTVPDPARIDAALERLAALAFERGSAIATASALPLTVDRIAAFADAAADRGILIVPASSLLAARPGG